MLLEALSIGGSLLGGLMQSNSANKAAKRQEQMQREAIAAQQQAAAKVGGLNAPGVAAYNTGLNALTARLGLPTGADGGPAGPVGSTDWMGYLATNPDARDWVDSVKGTANDQFGGDETKLAQYHWQADGNRRPLPKVEAPTGQPTPPTNSLNAGPGVFGHTEDPTWTAPAAFSFDPASFENSTGYKWAQEQGSGQVLANASATGALQSGAALKALQDRGQKTAYDFFDKERDFSYGKWADDYNRSWNEYNTNRNYLTNRYDRGTDDLLRYTGIGQNALNATGNALTGSANATATGLENIGNTQATNALTQGNIWSGVAGDVFGVAKGVINGWGGGSSKTKNTRS